MPGNKANNEADRQRCRELCRARCCRYIVIHLPAPRLAADYDEISWFLAHDNISAYFDKRRWHLEVRNPCKHLTKRNLCSIYETRPLVCRDHAADGCEYPEHPDHDLQFDTKEDFDAWWAAKRARARRKRAPRTKGAARAERG